MSKPTSTLVLLVLLLLSLVIPAEDLLGTAYDESDTQPYERASVTLDVVLSPASSETDRENLFGVYPSASPYSMRKGNADRHRTAEIKVTPSLFRILLC